MSEPLDILAALKEAREAFQQAHYARFHAACLVERIYNATERADGFAPDISAGFNTAIGMQVRDVMEGLLGTGACILTPQQLLDEFDDLSSLMVSARVRAQQRKRDAERAAV